MKDYFGYEGKIVVITGAASGMGAAATEMLLDLGARVYAFDMRPVELPVEQSFIVDLNDKASIDAALSELPESIDALFSCAGLPGVIYKGRTFDPVDVMMVNYGAPRYLVEQIAPKMPEGAAIAIIASQAGTGWKENIEANADILEIEGYDELREYLKSTPDAKCLDTTYTYPISKECIIQYAMARAEEFSYHKIRINVLNPGSTQTGMTEDFKNNYGAADALVTGIGRTATSEEMGQPLVFLNSKMASYLSGSVMDVDYGFMAGASTFDVPIEEMDF